MDTITLKIFKTNFSEKVIKTRSELNVEYQNTGEGIAIHMLIHLNHYRDIIQPKCNKLPCGFVAQNSKLVYMVCGVCSSEH